MLSLWTYDRVFANGGALDPSFGSGSGTVITDFGTDGEAYAMAIQADGKIVVAGRSRPDSDPNHNAIALARYNYDGTLDPTFGNGGKAIDTAQPGQALAVAIQSDGKILTSGSVSSNVARFNSDGSLDTSFGTSGRTGSLLQAYTMILQPDGKILVGGLIRLSYRTTNFAVARYNSDGTIDTTFGTGGKVTTQFYGGHDEIHALALQPDGKIVAAGQATWGGDAWYAVLARYDGNGNLDTSFGSSGKVTTDFSPNGGNKYHRLYAVAVQPDGKVVAAGASRYYENSDSLAVARYNSDGTADSTFGSAGQVTTKVLGFNASASGLALQPNGKIFVGGCATSSYGFSYGCSGGGGSFALLHYNSNGTPDTGFGTKGAVITQIYGGESATAIALQNDGKVVLAGSTAYGSGNYDFALARYLVDSDSPTPTPTPTPTPVPLRIDNTMPPAGRTSGGQQIVVTGAFAGLSTITMGGSSTSWVYTNGGADTSSITITTPAHLVGAVQINLTPTSGSVLSKSNAFAYLPTVFTDDALVIGQTTAKTQHIIELRQAVDAMRAVAGLGGAPWTDPTLALGDRIKAIHILDLRTWLDDAATRLGYSISTYTDPGLPPGFPIKRIHIEELRQRIRTIAG